MRMTIVEWSGYVFFVIGLVALCASVYYHPSEANHAFRWSTIVLLLSAVLMALSKICEVLVEIRDK